MCLKWGNWAQLFPLLFLCMPYTGSAPCSCRGGWQEAPRTQGPNPVPKGVRCGCAFPTGRTGTISSVTAPLGPITCEMPAGIKLFIQGHQTALQLVWESHLCLAMPSKASSPTLHSSSLRKELHMVKRMYKMVEIYGFTVLSRPLW